MQVAGWVVWWNGSRCLYAGGGILHFADAASPCERVVLPAGRCIDSVDAGGMFAELVHDPDVVTVELDTLHRFHHEWEAAASLLLRAGNHTALDAYDSHRRLHGHLGAAAVDAVADAAYAGLVEGRDVLVMAPTNAVVDELNVTLTDRLHAARRPDAADRIDLAGCVFYPGQSVGTRANNRTIRYGAGEWVRNGDRWKRDR